MAQIPKGRLVKGPYKPICRDSAIYFSSTVIIYNVYVYLIRKNGDSFYIFGRGFTI